MATLADVMKEIVKLREAMDKLKKENNRLKSVCENLTKEDVDHLLN